MGASKKKGSLGIVLGAIAGVVLLGGVGVAVAMMSGGPSEDGGAAANAIPLPTGAADGQPTTVGPSVTVAGEAPAATAPPAPSAMPSEEPAEPTAATTVAAPPSKPGTTKIVKPAPSAKPTASTKPTASAKPTSTPAPAPAPTSTAKQLEDDRK